MADTDITPLDKPPAQGLINGAIQAAPGASLVAPASGGGSAPNSTAYSAGTQARLNSWGLADDDVNVQTRLQKLGDPNSALMKMATGQSDQAFNKRGLLNSSMAVQSGQEAMMGKALEVINPDIDRLVNIARTDRDNEAAMARASMSESGANSRLNSQLAAQALENDKNNQARLVLQQQADKTAAERQALADKMALDRQTLSDKTALERMSQSDRSALERQAAADQTAMERLDKDIESRQRLATGQASDLLQANYRKSSQDSYDAYARDVNAIQTADLEPGDKAGQIAALNTMYTQRQQLNNSIYAAAPGWSVDWKQIVIDFGSQQPPGGGALTGGEHPVEQMRRRQGLTTDKPGSKSIYPAGDPRWRGTDDAEDRRRARELLDKPGLFPMKTSDPNPLMRMD